MMLGWQDYGSWPGKGHPLSDASFPYHPSPFHMLDVGACAQVILRDCSAYIGRLTDGLGITDMDSTNKALTFLATLHDLGKFTPGFIHRIKSKLPSGFPVPPPSTSLIHWEATFTLLRELDTEIAPWLGGNEFARKELYAAVAGHHGRPPYIYDAYARKNILQWTMGMDMARHFVADVYDLQGPFPLWLENVSSNATRAFSWWVSGLTSLADWVGSNQIWFPYADPQLSLAQYWLRAQEQAEYACRQAGVTQACLHKVTNWEWPSVFAVPTLRPMQEQAVSAELPAQPTLILLEDATGAGKTETALILAHRMMAQGKAQGIYFALPTMATANSMFDRVQNYVSKIFDHNSAPSVVLAHSRRAVYSRFKKSIRFEQTAWDYGTDLDSDLPQCPEWIASDLRRTFFATVGIGTLDQALMGALPIHYAPLRLWGLGNQILIVDEVHAYDAYMCETLLALLKFHVQAGGSAIVMTATLPNQKRQSIMQVYSDESSQVESFPALTLIPKGKKPLVHPVKSLPASERTVDVYRLGSQSEALDYVQRRAEDGAAVVWVRNSVNEAIAAWKELQRQGVEKVTLFHARYALCDRLRIEEQVLRSFDKDSKLDDRRGHVLISTQVIEQSLDLDFDCMVSDLAPIDLLIQRAGRIWRHMHKRPADERLTPNPILAVLSPDPHSVETENWLSDCLGGGSNIYPQAVLWRSADTVFRQGRIQSPHGLSALIENVYGMESAIADLPEALQRIADIQDGDRLAERNMGVMSTLKVADGYYENTDFNDETRYGTRLGEPTRVLSLARADEKGVLHPWSKDCDRESAWVLSDVSLRLGQFQRYESALLEQNSPQLDAARGEWGRYRRKSVVLAPVDEDGLIAPGLHYNCTIGLHFTET